MSRLGELLLREQIISAEQLQRAQEESRRSGERLGNSLIKMGAIEEEDLTQFLSRQYGVPAINLDEFDIEPEVIELIPKEVAIRHKVIPVNRAGTSLIVAMSDPSNIFAIDDLKFLTGYNIEVVVASEVGIDEAIARYYEKGLRIAARAGDGRAAARTSTSRPDEEDQVNAPTSRRRPKTRRSSSCAT